MPSVITDPQAYAKAIMERRRLLQMVQSGAAQVAGGSGTYIPKLQQEPQSIDPAQAASDGFRIPNYVSPAQVAGGSGTYMSNAPNPVSDAQVQGGSGDYMSRVQPSPDVAASGATPAQDDFFSFFNKPQATDAMAAFGAGMLRGKNFADGLANATEAVNNVSQKYRPYTDPEVQRMMQEASIKSQINRKLNPSAMQKGDIWYAPDGRSYREVFDPASGPRFWDNTAKQFVDGLPEGSTQRTDSAVGDRSREDAKTEQTFYNQYESSFSRLSSLQNMKQLIPTAGLGPDVLTGLTRNLASLTGRDIGDVKIANMQEFNKEVRNLELGKAIEQRGLGQFTEMERRIVREALATLETDPTAAQRIVDTMIKREERIQRLYNEWEESGKAGSFRSFVYRFNQREEDNQRQNAPVSGASSANISEADKISGYTP